MNLDLKPDERILAYGIASLVLTFIFPPIGLFVGLRTRKLARYAADGYRSEEPDELNPDYVKIGYWVGTAGAVIGGVITAVFCVWLLFMLVLMLAGAGTITFFGWTLS